MKLKAVLGCFALCAAVAAAEIVVNSGETLVLNDGSVNNNYDTIVRAKGGSTLKIAAQNGVEEGIAGFVAYHGTVMPDDAHWPAKNTTEAVALADFRYSHVSGVRQNLERVLMYETQVKDRQFDLYAAKWNVQNDMTISIFEHMASKVLVILDGTVLLSNNQWNQETARNDISIPAGEHSLVVVVATEGQNNCSAKAGDSNKNRDGRYGHANGGNCPGLVYNTSNAELTFLGLQPGISGVPDTHFFENATGGTAAFTTYMPATVQSEAGDANPVLNTNFRIMADGGEVTLDLSQCINPEAGILFRGGMKSVDGGSIVVKGCSNLRFGGYGSGDKHWAFFDVPMTFANADGTPNENGAVAFEDCATLFTLPANYTFADGMSAAWMGINIFGTGDATIANHTVQLLTPGAVAEGRTINVNAGQTLRLKPCKFNPDNEWQWFGVSGAFTNNIVLGGSGAKLMMPNVEKLDVHGSLSGVGDVEVEYETASHRSTAETTFDEATFSGTVTAIKGGIVFKQETPGAEDNTVIVSERPETVNDYLQVNNGWVRLLPPGAGETETIGRIRRVEAVAQMYKGEYKMNGCINVAHKQTMKIGTFSGMGSVCGEDEYSSVADCSAEIGVVETNSVLRVRVRKNMKIGTVQYGTTVRLMSSLEAFEADALEESVVVVVQGSTALSLNNAAKAQLRVEGNATRASLPAGAELGSISFKDDGASVVLAGGSVQSVSGRGTLIVTGAVRIGTIAPETKVRVEDGGSLTYMKDLAGGVYDLGEDINPAVWFDADAGAATYRQLSLHGHPNVVYTNDSVVIDRIYDVRPWQRDVFGWNQRCEGTTDTHQQVYPYLLANSCNGRTTLQFDKYGNFMTGVWSASFAEGSEYNRASRRMPFNKPVNARFAIMVFGSENGGGSSMLGGYRSNTTENGVTFKGPGVLHRFASEYYNDSAIALPSGSMKALATDWTKPIFRENRPTWVDGEEVDPTVTGFNGSYQIISFEMANDDGTDGIPVQALGTCGEHGNDGAGQIYGEVMIFTNVLTSVQRRRVEEYLSRKWAIPLKGENIPTAGRVEVWNGGTFAIDGDYVATGAQTGNVTLNGGELEIPALALPPTEADVPTENLMGWYDPDDETRYLKRQYANDTRPLAVDALFSKFSGTTADTYDGVAYLSGYVSSNGYIYDKEDTQGDRRPWKALGARGAGPVRTWLDYTVFSESDIDGNCMRMKTDFNQAVPANGNTGRVEQKYKTAFIVTDTSKGGGNVICDQQSMRPKAARVGCDVTSPIWAKNAPAEIVNGATYLDGVRVDGTVRGYTGGPELLSIVTDGNDSSLYAIGDYNGKGPNGEANNYSSEILGEMIFYTVVLDDATRASVEAYLMKKWLGKVPDGYVDWRDATIGGSGSVSAPSAAYLPKFADDFEGDVKIAGAQYDFAANASGMVTNALAFPEGVTVTLPAEGVVNVSGRVRSCVLIDAGAVIVGDQTKGVLDGWTLNAVRAGGKLKLENGKLKLAYPNGTAIVVR